MRYCIEHDSRVDDGKPECNRFRDSVAGRLTMRVCNVTDAVECVHDGDDKMEWLDDRTYMIVCGRCEA